MIRYGWSRAYDFSGSDLGTVCGRYAYYFDGGSASIEILDSSRGYENVFGPKEGVLVALYEKGCRLVCREVLDLSAGQGRTPATTR